MSGLRKEDVSFFQSIGLSLREVEAVTRSVARINAPTLSLSVHQLKGRYVLSVTYPGRWWDWSRVILHLSKSSESIVGAQNGEPVVTASPLSARFLFYLFLDAHNCDALVGDLEERYERIRKTFGERSAKFWYWAQAVRSVGPVAWTWAEKGALKPATWIIRWALAKGLVHDDSWLAILIQTFRRN